MSEVDRLVATCWPLPGHEAVARRLWEAYDAPGRAYHDTQHLTEVLDRVILLLEREPDARPHRDPILLGAWFHDAVHDAAGEDEERSAALAGRVLTPTPMSASGIEEVARLVRLTMTHDPAEQDIAGAVLCDADLGILAADEQRYAAYVAGVRREYDHVSPEDFARGRAAVLHRLVDRPHLFHTRYGRAHWEAPARRNVTAELGRLAS